MPYAEALFAGLHSLIVLGKTEWGNQVVNFINGGLSGFTVSSNMFGVNQLFKTDLLSAKQDFYTRSLDLLHATGLRYPGGAMTESDFDVEHPDARPLTYTKDKPFVGITEFLDYVRASGHAATIVLPTEKMYKGALIASSDIPRQIDKTYLDKVVSYVTKLLTHGDSGPASLPDAPIYAFEIGNEYWLGGKMTAKEYGQVVNVLTSAIEGVFDRILGTNTAHPKVMIQMGGPWDPQYKDGGLHASLAWNDRIIQSNQDIIGQITDLQAKKAITTLLEHYYYANGDDRFSPGPSSTNFMANDIAQWKKAGFSGLDLYMTEWGIKLGNTEQYGLKAASVAIEQMQYMLQLGADGAFAWPVQNGPTHLVAGSPLGPVLSPTGAAFALMAEDLVGMTLLNAGISQAGLEVDGYRSVTKAVFFIMSRSDASQDVHLDFSSVVKSYTSLSGVLLGVAPGVAVDDPKATAVLTSYSSNQLGDAKDVHINLKPFEILEIEFETPIGIRLSGTASGDRLTGGLGDDTLYGFEGNDTLTGNIGSDLLYGGNGRNMLNGWDGDDTIIGGDNSDAIGGQQGDDFLRGGQGNDTIDGGSGSDTIEFINSLRVDVNLNILTAQVTGDGTDTILNIENILTSGGNDRIIGSNFQNVIRSQGGHDIITGMGGSDTLYGGSGNDSIFGGADNDNIFGEDGADYLYGQTGRDILFGGALDGQRDVFVYTSIADSPIGAVNRDSIYDFVSKMDVIKLSDIDANIRKSGDQAFIWGGHNPTANGVWYTVSGRDVIILGDVNGDRVSDFEISIAGVSSLVLADFIL